MRHRAALLATLVTLLASPATAQIVDDFQADQHGWRYGIGMPTRVANMGEDGAGDWAMRVVTTGGVGAVSRLAVINTASRVGDAWVGDWSGRDQVNFRVLNTGGSTLTLRVGIEGTPFAERWVTTEGVEVPSSPDWQVVTLSTRQSDFQPDVGTNLTATYANVTQFRIIHNPSPAWRSVPIAGTFYFDDITDGVLPGTCGNGIVDSAAEQCDAMDLGGQTCVTRGFDGGTLGCRPECQFDTSSCSACGDGTREGSEVCDMDDLGGATCISRGFDGGALGCAGTCASFDESACTDCGDGVREGDEVCDTDDLGAESCLSQGLGPGDLGCNSACSAFDASMCSTCGNAMLDTGEVCDGTLLDGQDCESLGLAGGTLACAGCSAFDTSACFGCGDGAVNGSEVCDGVALSGMTCSDRGFAEGVLACAVDCTAFDTADCFTCGDMLCARPETLTGCPMDCSVVDDFEDGTVMAWRAGGVDPTLTPDMGPTGAGDDALVVAPSGTAGRLVVQNSAQWAGDFASREREVIYAHVRNLGPSPIELRLAIDGPGGRFVTTSGVALPAAGGFQIAAWSLAPADLTADGGSDLTATLHAVTTMRIVHGDAPAFVGLSSDSSFVIDNVSDLALAPICGDGSLNAPSEICDDGNRDGGDGCSATCASDTCGDGVLQPELEEQCDDGEANSDSAPDACRTNCRRARCGDGTLDTGELCDTVAPAGETCVTLGFLGGRLGCSTGCALDLTACRRGCGDGRVQAPEQCDDGNMEDGDGCSAMCRVETDGAPPTDDAGPRDAGPSPGMDDAAMRDGGLSDAGDASPSTGGCGCRVQGTSGSFPSPALLILGLWVLRRRRSGNAKRSAT